MEHVKKMILLPSETVAKIHEKPVTSTPGDIMSGLDREMHQIMQKRADDSEKWKQYEQALQKYMYFVHEQRKPTKLIFTAGEPKLEEEEDPLRTELITVIPSTFKVLATTLFDRLKNNNHIVWDENGRVKIEGIVLQNSNIIDLIGDAVRARKKGYANGWKEFATALCQTHVPADLIRNAAYKRAIQTQRGAGSTSISPTQDGARKRKHSLKYKREKKPLRWVPWCPKRGVPR